MILTFPTACFLLTTSIERINCPTSFFLSADVGFMLKDHAFALGPVRVDKADHAERFSCGNSALHLSGLTYLVVVFGCDH